MTSRARWWGQRWSASGWWVSWWWVPPWWVSLWWASTWSVGGGTDKGFHLIDILEDHVGEHVVSRDLELGGRVQHNRGTDRSDRFRRQPWERRGGKGLERGEEVNLEAGVVVPDAIVKGLVVLKVENGRKNVKSAPYRPILSANTRRQRPTAVYAHADPAQNGQNGGH